MKATLTAQASLVLILMSVSTDAFSHHVVSETGIAWAEPVSVLELDTQAASFDLGPRNKGRWQTMALRLQMAPLSWFSVSLRVPFSAIQFEDGRQALGLGDLEAALQVRLFASPHGGLIASAGVGAELPTGVEEDQLGSGHVELTPYLIASTQPLDHVILTSVLSYRTAITGEPQHQNSARAATGSVLAPHSAQEFSARLDAAWVEEQRWYASAGVEAILMIAQDQPNPIHGRLEVGWLPDTRWRLALGVERHLRGESRMRWKGKMNLAWLF